MVDHADAMEQPLNQHRPAAARVALSLTEDVFLRSS
jgi:hypothetical protein